MVRCLNRKNLLVRVGVIAIITWCIAPEVDDESHEVGVFRDGLMQDSDMYSFLQIPGATTIARGNRITGVTRSADSVSIHDNDEKVSWRITFPNGYTEFDLQAFCQKSLLESAVCTFQGHPSESGIAVVGVIGSELAVKHALETYPGAEHTLLVGDVFVADDAQEVSWQTPGVQADAEALQADEQQISTLQRVVDDNAGKIAQEIINFQLERRAAQERNISIMHASAMNGTNTSNATNTSDAPSQAAPATWNYVLASFGPVGGMLLLLAELGIALGTIMVAFLSFVGATLNCIASGFWFVFGNPYSWVCLAAAAGVLIGWSVGGMRGALVAFVILLAFGFIYLFGDSAGLHVDEAVEVVSIEDTAVAYTVIFFGVCGAMIGWFVGQLPWACLGFVWGLCIGMLNHVAHLWTGTTKDEQQYMGFGIYLVFVALTGYIYKQIVHYSSFEMPLGQKNTSRGGFAYGLMDALHCDPNPNVCLVGCFFLPALWADTSVFGKLTDGDGGQPKKRYWTHLLGFAFLSAMGYFTYGIGSVLLLIWLVWNRQKIRRVHGLDYATLGSVFEDSLAWLCCGPCASMQEAMQVSFVEIP